MKKLFFGLITTLLTTSCSVQQFAVNTKTEPFQNGGFVVGERVEKCGKDGWKLDYRKDRDVHLLGINVRKSNVKGMVDDLKATSYTIETKSNLWVTLLTSGIVDYKVVKVIKRDN